MIFPKQLTHVTFYIPDNGEYYELAISGGELRFSAEPFYSRDAISAKKQYLLRGLRIDMDLSFQQSLNHDTIRALWNAIYLYPNGEMQMYLRPQEDVDIYTDYFVVLATDFAANHTYSNTIGRHGYNMRFSTVLPDIGIGLAYLVNTDEVFVLNNDSEKIFVDLVNY